jgi:hypothetical protein
MREQSAVTGAWLITSKWQSGSDEPWLSLSAPTQAPRLGQPCTVREADITVKKALDHILSAELVSVCGTAYRSPICRHPQLRPALTGTSLGDPAAGSLSGTLRALFREKWAPTACEVGIRNYSCA